MLRCAGDREVVLAGRMLAERRGAGDKMVGRAVEARCLSISTTMTMDTLAMSLLPGKDQSVR